MSSTAATPAPQPDAPRLFLLPRRPGRDTSILEWLADQYRLYPYGRFGISALVRSESERAALLLTVVFLFDLFSWSLLWNAVFHRGELQRDGQTVFAIFIGTLFAAVVFSFEQGFITSDWTKRKTLSRVKLVAASILRVAAIVASAFVTSQPLELLVFAHDIQDRVHQERIWEEIIARALVFQDLEKQLHGEGPMEQKIKDYNTAQSKLVTATGDLAVAQRQRDSARRQRGLLQGQLEQLRAKAKTDPDASERIAATASQIARQNKTINDLEDTITRKESEVGSNQTVATRTSTAYEKAKTDVEASQRALRKWITKLSRSRPTETTISGKGDLDGYEFVEQPYSFVEQRRVLEDLRLGHPMQRRNLISIGDAMKNLELQDPKVTDDGMASNRADSAAVMNQFYWALFVVAMFIPGLGLLFKLTIHARLRDYYSEEYQAASGNLDAIRAIQTDERVQRTRRETPKDDRQD